MKYFDSTEVYENETSFRKILETLEEQNNTMEKNKEIWYVLLTELFELHFDIEKA